MAHVTPVPPAAQAPKVSLADAFPGAGTPQHDVVEKGAAFRKSMDKAWAQAQSAAKNNHADARRRDAAPEKIRDPGSQECDSRIANIMPPETSNPRVEREPATGLNENPSPDAETRTDSNPASDKVPETPRTPDAQNPAIPSAAVLTAPLVAPASVAPMENPVLKAPPPQPIDLFEPRVPSGTPASEIPALTIPAEKIDLKDVLALNMPVPDPKSPVKEFPGELKIQSPFAPAEPGSKIAASQTNPWIAPSGGPSLTIATIDPALIPVVASGEKETPFISQNLAPESAQTPKAGLGFTPVPAPLRAEKASANAWLLENPLATASAEEPAPALGTFRSLPGLDARMFSDQGPKFETAPHLWQALANPSQSDPSQKQDAESDNPFHSAPEDGDLPFLSLETPDGGGRDAWTRDGTQSEPRWEFAPTQDVARADWQPKFDPSELKEAARETPARATLPNLQAVLLHQVAARLTGAMANREELVVQVDPPHLGKVQVALEMHHGQIAARISVETESVRQLLENQFQSLRQSLEQQGVRLESLQVSVQDRHASLMNPDGQNAESFFHRRGHSGHGSSATETGFEGEEPSADDTGRRWGYNTVEYFG